MPFDPFTQLVYPEPCHPMRNRFDLIGIKGFVPVYCQQNFAIFPREEMVIGRRSSQRFPRAIEWSAYSMELFFSSSDRLRSPAYQCRRNRSWNTLVYHEPFTAFSRNDKCYSNRYRDRSYRCDRGQVGEWNEPGTLSTLCT